MTTSRSKKTKTPELLAAEQALANNLSSMPPDMAAKFVEMMKASKGKK